MQVKWNKKSQSALDKAISYGYEIFGEKVAIDFYRQIKKYEVYLKENPEMGSFEPFLHGRELNYRSLKVHKHYKIVYHIIGDTVQISDLRILVANPKS